MSWTDILDVQPGFLRSPDAAGLLRPRRSAGGHRRYSRTELALAARVRELLDENMPLAAAFRIVTLEHQLEFAQRHIAELEARQRPARAVRATPVRAQGPGSPGRRPWSGW